jgi:murein DD-endopeptidase MepM/ murein hydrolase activator NlpD
MSCAALPIAPPGRVTSPYGWRNRPSGPDLHTGVDLGAPEGTAVYAMLPGIVRVSAPSGELERYGNVVVLEHTPSLFSLSAHLLARNVVQGERVSQGQQIGTVGRTAGTRADPSASFASSGAHLHLEFLRRWPPAGRDLDRLNPATVLGELGVIVPASGPLMLACAVVPSSPSSPAVPMPAQAFSSASRPRSLNERPITFSRARAAGGAMVPLFLLFAAYAARNS